jgi:hypothetical protein
MHNLGTVFCQLYQRFGRVERLLSRHADTNAYSVERRFGTELADDVLKLLAGQLKGEEIVHTLKRLSALSKGHDGCQGRMIHAGNGGEHLR